jgi:hypothetical protein
MRFGLRKPSIRKRIAARTSWKRYVRHSLGLKAPRGWGWLTNPRRAAYNRVYNRTTIGLGKGCLVAIVLYGAIVGSVALALALVIGAARSDGALERRGPGAGDRGQERVTAGRSAPGGGSRSGAASGERSAPPSPQAVGQVAS